MVANEYDYRRAEILRENVMKWGYPHVAVSRGDTALISRLRDTFHIIAADVPCSGEGMMRKDPKAAAQWSEALVRQCVERQREILDNLWEALRPGGYLIYSTCTFNTAENEQQLAWLTERYGAEPVELPLHLFPGAVKPGSMLRFLPGRVRGEGLAIGVVRKPADAAPQPATPPKSRAASRHRRAPRSPAATDPRRSGAWHPDRPKLCTLAGTCPQRRPAPRRLPRGGG